MPLFGKKHYTTVKVRKRDIPNGLWLKCPSCTEIIFKQEIENALGICPKCGYHFQVSRKNRIAQLTEPGSFQEWDAELISVDTLGFTGTAAYKDKLQDNIKKTGYNDAISCGRAQIGRHAAAFGVMDFEFLGASMGAVVGEKVARMFERATAARLPVVLVCASGGARMYEGMFSLMQMAKTSVALHYHKQARLPYISVLTNPTMAGIMASFAGIGDVMIAEPKALIGFTGPRVIEQTIRQKLPAGFQRSEFLLEHGLIDMIVHRKELKKQLSQIVDYMVPGAV